MHLSSRRLDAAENECQNMIWPQLKLTYGEELFRIRMPLTQILLPCIWLPTCLRHCPFLLHLHPPRERVLPDPKAHRVNLNFNLSYLEKQTQIDFISCLTKPAQTFPK